MRPLYEIENELEDVIERLTDPETGEIVHPEILDALEMERSRKIEGVCLAIRNRTAELEMVDREKVRLSARERALERQIEGMKGWLSFHLNGETFCSPRVQVSYRQSYSAEIREPKLVPAQYRIVKEEVSYDRMAIRKILMDGGKVPGAELKERKAVYVK